MSNALILNGSPRGKKSSSESLANYMKKLFETEGIESEIILILTQLNKEERIKEMVEKIKSADYVVLFAPLYDDCQPSFVTKTMEIIAEEKMNLSNKVFIPIINCGLPEPEQISEGVIPIYNRFATTVGFKWGGSLAIGGGEGIQGRFGKQLDEIGTFAKNAIEALNDIVQSLVSEIQYPNVEIILVPKIFYKWPLVNLMTSINTKSWKKMAEKKGEKVDAQPYLEK